MTKTDESFRDEYKPLHIPAHYDFNDDEQERVLFALAQIGSGTIIDVANELVTLEPGNTIEELIIVATNVLTPLYQKGLLKGVDTGNEIKYNLSKITEANDGAVDPDLLAPGLD